MARWRAAWDVKGLTKDFCCETDLRRFSGLDQIVTHHNGIAGRTDANG